MIAKITVYRGQCEQWAYSRMLLNGQGPLAAIKDILRPSFAAAGTEMKNVRLKRMPPLHMPGHGLPKGAAHFRVTYKKPYRDKHWCHSETILVIPS